METKGFFTFSTFVYLSNFEGEMLKFESSLLSGEPHSSYTLFTADSILLLMLDSYCSDGSSFSNKLFLFFLCLEPFAGLAHALGVILKASLGFEYG